MNTYTPEQREVKAGLEALIGEEWTQQWNEDYGVYLMECLLEDEILDRQLNFVNLERFLDYLIDEEDARNAEFEEFLMELQNSINCYLNTPISNHESKDAAREHLVLLLQNNNFSTKMIDKRVNLPNWVKRETGRWN
jgi:hypothetical protein